MTSTGEESEVMFIATLYAIATAFGTASVSEADLLTRCVIVLGHSLVCIG